MKRILLTGLAWALAAGLVVAQGTPDFSGSWTLDKEKSTMPQMGGPGGGPGGGPRGGGTAESIVITQTAAELTREAKMGERVQTRLYKLDGTESVNQTGRGQTKSTSKWDGSRLVTSGVNQFDGPNGPMTIESKEIMSLDATGNLVVETTTKSPMGERTTKLVYRKAS